MKKRRFGRTGHLSTVLTFGSAAFMEISQHNADGIMELVLAHNVNHIDVAPEYGQAEIRIGPWMKKHRDLFFLNCKTLMRSADKAREELHRSLERLQTDRFDLYQLHSVDQESELETALGPGGALEAILEGKSQKLLQYIGITSHNLNLLQRALTMFDFDTIMFPFNYIFYADPGYREQYNALMKTAKTRDIGIMIIKSVARGNWEHKYQVMPMQRRPYSTWYKPFDTQHEIDRALHFVLSHDISTAVTPSDGKLLPMVLDAAERFEPMSSTDRVELIEEAKEYKTLQFTF